MRRLDLSIQEHTVGRKGPFWRSSSFMGTRISKHLMNDSVEVTAGSGTLDVRTAHLENRAISRSAFLAMVGGLFSVLAGFLNQVIIAAYFGASASMDAYLTALVIPAYFQAVLVSGLSLVFIPVFVAERTKGNEDAAWKLVGTFFWITVSVLGVIGLAGSLLATNIITISAPGFGSEKSMLAARMLSVLMFSIPFSGLTSYTTGIQHARNSFFWPAFGGAINSIGSVLVVVLLEPMVGPLALPWGFLTASVLQSLVTVLPVLRHGWPNIMPLADSRVKEMAKLIVPFILFGLLMRGNTLFERYFASGLPTGQVSYLGYAAKLSTIYQQLLASGISAAIFPAMARAYSQSGGEGLGAKTIYGLRLTLAVALPAIVISSALSTPLVQVVFERGEFHAVDTLHVAQVLLLAMVSGVLCVTLGNTLSKTYYVLKDTLSPSVISAASVLLYLGIGGYFSSRWGYVGLAYASVTQQVLFVLALYILLFHKLRGASWLRIVEDVVTYAVAAVCAFLIAKLAFSYLVSLPTLLNLAISALLSALFYLAVLFVCDREIMVALLEMFGLGRLIEHGRRGKKDPAFQA